jgi:hypothetical protein
MANEMQTLAGDCPTHGTVEAVRGIPKGQLPADRHRHHESGGQPPATLPLPEM